MPQRPDTGAQLFLLPPSLDELVANNHAVRYVASFVDALSDAELADLAIAVDESPLGAPRYAPRMLLRLWLSGFVLGIRSARGLERGTQERFDLYWAAHGQHPDHNTLWRFYRQHRSHMRQLLRATITTAVAIGLVDLAVQAVDGTKVLANANPDARLNPEQWERLVGETEAAIADLEARNQGNDPPPPGLPTELQDATALRERIVAARGAGGDAPPPTINGTDPQASWMQTRQGIRLAYNAQLVVTPTDPQVGQGPGRIILAAAVTTQGSDHGLLVPMAQAAHVPQHPMPITLADAGYCNQATLLAADRAEITLVSPQQRRRQDRIAYPVASFTYDPDTDTYRCPMGASLPRHNQTTSRGMVVTRYRTDGHRCQACAAFGSCTTSRAGRTLKISAAADRMRQHDQWMATESARTLSAQRKGLIEPVFGTLKDRFGARRTHLRGRANVEAEWIMTAIAFNLRTLARAQSHPLAA